MIEHLFPDLSTRSTKNELMDSPDADPEMLRRTFDQFKWMNLLVSRYRTLLNRYIISDMLRNPGRSYTMLDIGCGGCDIPVWMRNKCCERHIDIHITCIDTDLRAIEYARGLYGKLNGLEITQKSVFDLDKFGGRFDYIFANHFLHHLPDDQLVAALQQIHKATARLFVISDLRRSNLSYFVFTILVAFIFRDSLIYPDGKQSIKRGFLLSEIKYLVKHLGIEQSTNVGQLPFGRLYLVCRRYQEIIP